MSGFVFSERFDSLPGENGMHLEICPVPRTYFAWYEGIEDHRIYLLDLEKD